MIDKIHTSIRASLFVFVLVFAGSLVAAIISYAYLDAITEDEIKAKRNTQVWKSKIEKAQENNLIIVEYELPYKALIENSIVGEENRLSWFETLQQTANARGLDLFKFSTASQAKVTTKNMKQEYANLNIFKSTMGLDMVLSHEGDLFSVFNNLDTKANGLYSVHRCLFTGKGKSKISEKIELSAGLQARCELNWYTIKPEKT